MTREAYLTLKNGIKTSAYLEIKILYDKKKVKCLCKSMEDFS